MKKEYPKNRIDLILQETINSDIKILNSIQEKYRGVEKRDELNSLFKNLYRLLREIV